MKKLFVLALLVTYCLSAEAGTPDYSTAVAPILYQHCTSCHHTGGLHFPLMTYSDAVANAGGIQADVQNHYMPPWPPDPTYSHLSHARILSQQEIDTLIAWVNGGTPQGIPSLAPPQPVYTNMGDIPGTPDLVTKIPTYTSTATPLTGDVYQCFVVPSGQLADKYISGFEAIPGNAAIVHHVLVYADTTGTCRHLDSMSPGPGYISFGGVGSNNAILLGGWVPGSSPLVYPAGFGVQLPHNADIVIQVHYPAGTAGQVDSTRIRFFFSKSPNVRSVFITPILNYFTNINAPLSIPANTVKTFTETQKLPGIDFSLLGIAPHMHLIGTSINAWGVTPAKDTLNFIRINKWDFHWQGFYLLPKIMKIPAGSTVYGKATYDNTPNNPHNPSNPPQNVVAGENTTNEMMLIYFVYTYYQPGDEHVVIDSTYGVGIQPVSYYHGQQLLEAYPNPAHGQLIVKYYMENADEGSINLISSDGRLVKQLSQQHLNSGYTATPYSINDLAPGFYTLRLQTSTQLLTQKIIIQ
jgi:hypothetical protein